MPRTDAEHDKAAQYASLRRRSGDPAAVKARNEILGGLGDWTGKCAFCNAELRGTPAELTAHRCDKYEASLG
jgi:hypothetical protein